MSNALAIAHVTQALALLIENNLRPEIDMAVSVETRKPPAEPPAEPALHVFLYQVTPNTARRNDDLVTRASDGTLLTRPAAALDLHYVISAYGEETELVGQRLIGSVVRTLHEIPVLPRDVIESAGEHPYLAGSDLGEAEQRVRFVPQVMDIDETSKLWGMLHQTPYALSVTYTGTLVLIDGRERPVPPKPVETRTVRALPFGAPGAPVPPVIGEYPLPGEDESAPAASDGDGAGDGDGDGNGDRSGSGTGGRAAGRSGSKARSGSGSGSGTRAKAAAKAAAPKAGAAKAAASGTKKSAAAKPGARTTAKSAGAKSASGGATSRSAVKAATKTTAAKRARQATRKPLASRDEGTGEGQGQSQES
ncbi:DUF4255 domain-containing protein [Streptomyces sp. SCSIO ZS0520]|uniref:DUF4255 domain-containing protein n=1 Tax=Streptomyces sp. SCSIO ZS0520 TaxID=2892996 RepID=UPI0021DB4DD0|nr:DUF4255 domain-containing protein [Streptomyces sp. SCSIO ZS0520]